MVAQARQALRNAGWLLAQRVLHLAGAALFAILVPRMLGPSAFGRYALLVSVSVWFSLASGLGVVSILTRSVPGLVGAGDQLGLRRLASSLMALRAATAAFSAAGYLLVVTGMLGEPDLVAAAFVAGAVFCRAVGDLGFALFLGLNDAARWGIGDLARRWCAVVLVPAGFLAAGLRGACGGLLAGEVLVLGLSLWWARPYLGRAFLDFSRRHLAPILRVGSLFWAGNLLVALTQRTGETLVRVATGRFDEVGYYGAAYAMYLTAAQALWQIVVALAPHLVAQLEAGRRDTVALWLERLLAYAVAASVLSLAGGALLGQDLVRLLLGRQYEPVAVDLLPLLVALVAATVGSVGRLLALALDRPRVIIGAAGFELAAFWVLGFPLAQRLGSLGACLAMVPASALYAWIVTARVRAELPYSLLPARRALAAAVVFVPLVFLRGSWALNALLFALGATAYVLMLAWAGVISRAEFARLRRALEDPSSTPAESP